MTPRKRSFLHALNNAAEGFIHVVRHERNMRVHFLCALLLLLAAFFLGIQRTDWLILCSATCLVLMAEMINTVIEKTLDLLHSKFHPSVGLIKDISAGMVLVTSRISSRPVISGIMLSTISRSNGRSFRSRRASRGLPVAVTSCRSSRNAAPLGFRAFSCGGNGRRKKR